MTVSANVQACIICCTCCIRWRWWCRALVDCILNLCASSGGFYVHFKASDCNSSLRWTPGQPMQLECPNHLTWVALFLCLAIANTPPHHHPTPPNPRPTGRLLYVHVRIDSRRELTSDIFNAYYTCWSWHRFLQINRFGCACVFWCFSA